MEKQPTMIVQLIYKTLCLAAIASIRVLWPIDADMWHIISSI